ncbi:MAG TPA: hypothetical protein VFU99_11260 [Gaiellaceae bacterium]|nr:hypothetical protein [Gaiellaceae bacterium]
MKKTLILLAAFAVLVVPAALAAPPAGKGKPESPGNSQAAHQQQSVPQSAAQHAAQTCKAERARLGVEVFKTTYGTNKNKTNAFGKCVSQTVDNAAKKCKKLRKDDPAGFKTQYGDKPNAYGKCVSANAKKTS